MQMKRFHRSVFVIALWLTFIVLTYQPVVFAQEGTLEKGEITSPALENLINDPVTRPFFIYLPPSYQTSDKRYPTVYVLHGFSGNARGPTSIRSTIDSMVQNGNIGEMIFVFPDGSNRFGGSMYLSSETIGDYETYIVTDLVKHIEANYRTIAYRQSRGITGFSMGGWGSMRFGLKYPETFSVVVAQAAPTDLDSDWWKYLSRNAALANPKDWGMYNKVSAFSQFVFAVSAGANPNPSAPPFFLDLTYKLANGKAQVVPERWNKNVNVDTVNGLLDKYLNQPVRLKGIKFVHGTSDSVVPVSQARTLDKVLTERSVAHVYVEHEWGHVFMPEESLQFLSDNLAFKVLP